MQVYYRWDKNFIISDINYRTARTLTGLVHDLELSMSLRLCRVLVLRNARGLSLTDEFDRYNSKPSPYRV